MEVQRQKVLAEFGVLALECDDLDVILTEACRLVGRALNTDLAKVVELHADGKTMSIRAGVGFAPGTFENVELTSEDGSAESYALKSREPIITSNIEHEHRFKFAQFLIVNGVKAIINVPIIGTRGGQPYGLLQVDSRTPRSFTNGDVDFLRSYANLIAAAVSRIRAAGAVVTSGVRQKLLLEELQHRSRNLLSVIIAIARRTFQPGPELDEFSSRLESISRVQGLLSRDRSWSADLGELIRAELRAHGFSDSERISITGQHLMLPGDAIQPLALALHELTTNAVKYGALSPKMSGQLTINWNVERHEGEEGGASLCIDWKEASAPWPTPPLRRGFGRELIEKALPHQLRGITVLEFEPDGVHCTIRMPLTQPKGLRP